MKWLLSYPRFQGWAGGIRAWLAFPCLSGAGRSPLCQGTGIHPLPTSPSPILGCDEHTKHGAAPTVPKS